MDKLEIHYTPKHGSWLNMAEIELSVLSRRCLAQRLGTVSRLTREVAAWTQARNASATTVDWQFTAEDARTKLKRLYPVPVGEALPLAKEAAPESRRTAKPPAEQATTASRQPAKRLPVHGAIT